MFRLLASLFLAAACASPAFAWGKIGHRVTAEIADHYLSQPAHDAVTGILGTESMAEAADWPDHMRSNPDNFWRSEANPWHYVTIPTGQTYAEAGAPPEGDAVSALAKFRAQVLDPATSPEDKALALRFIIHIIGDLQQPLHAGNGTDRGGNDFLCTWFDEVTNLHMVWDEKLIQYEELSYTEWTAWLLPKITPDLAADWASSGPADWADESTALMATVYPANRNLKWEYAYAHRDEVRLRLSQGGVRLAAYLNAMFDPAPEPAPVN